MNHTVIFNDFVFTEFCYNTYRHNDVTSGIAYHYIAYMRQGHCNIVAGKQSFRVNEGDFFYLPKGFRYHSHWYAGQSGVVRFDSYAFKTMPRWNDIIYPPQAIAPFADVMEWNQRLAEDKRVDFSSIGFFYQLLGLLVNKMVCLPADRKSMIVQKAEEHMRENVRCSAAELARHCNISQTALYEAFKATRGYTPIKAKHKIAVEQACLLLKTTDLPVTEIIQQLGFSSDAYFRKVFFQQTGKTPRQVQKESDF